MGASDANSVAVLQAFRKGEECQLVRNCSLLLFPPKGQAIDISPQYVDIVNNVGSLTILVDEHLTWYWDEPWKKTNSSHINNNTTKKNGQVEIIFEMHHAASTWKHATFDILLTTYIRKLILLNLILSS